MRLLKTSLALVASALSIVAASAAAAPVHIKIGVLTGPGEDIARVVEKVAPRYNLKVEPVVFDGVVNPNVALDAGDIQANFFQHQLHLNAEIANRGYKLASIGRVYNSPLAFYSFKVKSLKQLPDRAIVSIPEDDPNQSRALLALQDNGIIKLKSGIDTDVKNVSLADVAENPKHLQFKDLSWAILPRSLKDVDAGGINATHAYRLANLKITDAVGVESSARTAKYSSVVVVQSANKDKEWATQLIKAFQSPEVAQFIRDNFKDVLVPAFEVK